MSGPNSKLKAKSPRVFFPAQHGVRFDTQPAEQYGARTYLLDEHVNPFNVDHVLREIEHALDVAKFDPAIDYIAMTGNYALVSFLVATAFRSYDHLQLLMFDAVTGEYRRKRVNLRQWASEGRRAAR